MFSPPESIMLATFFVLWPFAAASLFALAKFFDQRDQQLADSGSGAPPSVNG